MSFHDELCFVQFMHQGGEHQPDGDAPMGWNRDTHKRKFVEITGQCHKQEAAFEGPLRFWAEWEPQSDVTRIERPLDHGPRFVHRPFYAIPDSYRGLQNTDPFVFGSFFYTWCKENRCNGPTQLRYLKRGSVILFGSCIGGQFAVDTVFVVDKGKDHNAANFQEKLKNLVPQTYWDVTLRACYQDNDNARCCGKSVPVGHRLYWGATIDNPVDGMFSFFPCMPADQSPRGFARPVIAIPNAITNQLRQGYKLNCGLSLEKVTGYWKCVRDQVESKGRWLGVQAGTPERRSDPP